jgi:GntR family transcriptional regulator / MocR family aminotransferase
MATHPPDTPLPMLRIDRRRPVSLQQQIYDGLREGILGGALEPGTRLLSTREFAIQFNLARITVNNAFDQLKAEGYLEARTGDGTYVARTLPDDLTGLSTSSRAAGETLKAPQVSSRSRFMTELWEGRVYQRVGLRPFQLDVPALDCFPLDLWRKLESRHLGHGDILNLTYGDPAGHLPLRAAIATHLRAHRAMDCDAGQILITHGSRQGLNLAAQVLIDAGDPVWVEDPVCHDALTSFRLAGAGLVPVPIDEEGLNVAQGKRLAPRARLAYVCPSYHFPLGVTLSLSRRLALLEWASRTDAWIVEDDFDGEYRYVGRPLASLHGLDHEGRVIYVGTFSRALFPGLRLGYLVVPKGLMKAFTAARSLMDRGSSLVSQMTLADFMEEGHFHRHLRRMRLVNAQRRDALVSDLRKHLGHVLEVEAPEAGLHILSRLATGHRDTELAKRAAQEGIIVIPLSPYYQKATASHGLLFGFAGFHDKRLRESVRRLAGLFD